ncbi:MAG TPA: dihydrofolate reductase [Candidatus Paceibacterota bacterium]|nr:dihydrofolate reductase [Candidatus Paceibacterota bacterium]
MEPELCIIAAYEETTRVMGRGNQLLWRIRDDLRRFAALTTGQAVIMGRRTFESLGSAPLFDRHNIVVSRTLPPKPGIAICTTLEQALDLASSLGTKRVFAIGGERVFAEVLPRADVLFLTLVHDPSAIGDVFFPLFDESAFERTEDEDHPKRRPSFRFLTLKRKTAAP